MVLVVLEQKAHVVTPASRPVWLQDKTFMFSTILRHDGAEFVIVGSCVDLLKESWSLGPVLNLLSAHKTGSHVLLQLRPLCLQDG